MHGKSVLVAMAILLVAVAFGAVAAGTALAQTGATTRAYQPVPPGASVVGDVREGTADLLVYARWGCIFAALAMVGVIWVGWSLRTIARNQVELGRLIRDLELSRARKQA